MTSFSTLAALTLVNMAVRICFHSYTNAGSGGQLAFQFITKWGSGLGFSRPIKILHTRLLNNLYIDRTFFRRKKSRLSLSTVSLGLLHIINVMA